MKLRSVPSSAGKRDVALTTLIDLLVQIVFVFTLLLVASGVMDGFINPKSWQDIVKTLPIQQDASPEDQAKEIARQLTEAISDRERLTREVAGLSRERADMKQRLAQLDQKVAELSKKLGGPGYPPCRGADSAELTVAHVRIDRQGRIAVQLLPGATAIAADLSNSGASARSLDRSEFSRVFQAWRERGLGQSTPCQYSGTLTFDPNAPAGEYQPSYSRVRSIFFLRSATPDKG